MYLPLYCESECVLPFASVSEKSGAALPTGGESSARSVVVTSEARIVKIDLVFISYCEATVREMVSSLLKIILLVSNSGKTIGSADLLG